MSELLNPDDFVIVRRRKKYRFAKFANAENCFEFDEWTKKKIDVVELGAGTAFFLVELARRYPEKIFAAVDVKADRLQRGAYEALEQNIKNIVFIKARADQLDELFEANSIESLWLTFADPFPRDRSARRRMTHPMFLEKYALLLKKSGKFYMKHDNPAFFAWSLEQLVAEKWRINELSFDLHESTLAEDYKILTSYEQRWLDEGRITSFANATPQI
jgi:tRNA (guanine-N7-)-methyltransferase